MGRYGAECAEVNSHKKSRVLHGTKRRESHMTAARKAKKAIGGLADRKAHKEISGLTDGEKNDTIIGK